MNKIFAKTKQKTVLSFVTPQRMLKKRSFKSKNPSPFFAYNIPKS